MEDMKPFAVLTGGSSGIGLALAKRFAANGYDVLIAAQSEENLARAAREIGGDVQTFAVNLREREGVEALYGRIRSTGRPLDAIAINAGVGVGGDFATGTDLEREIEIIELNVTSTVILAKLVLKDMVAQGEGRVLFTASVASIPPSDYEAVYGASKAFVHSFALSLRGELKDTGVSVTALMPGPAETNFFHRAGMDDTKVGQGKKLSPDEVAEAGFNALMSGDEKVMVASPMFKATVNLANLIPDAVQSGMHQKMSGPGTGTQDKDSR